MPYVQGHCNLAVWLHADSVPGKRILPFDGTRLLWAKGLYALIEGLEKFLEPGVEVFFKYDQSHAALGVYDPHTLIRIFLFSHRLEQLTRRIFAPHAVNIDGRRNEVFR